MRIDTDTFDYLVTAPGYMRLVNLVTRALDGDAVEVPTELMPLYALGHEDREAFEDALRDIGEARKDNPDTRKTDYQRELMRERRARLAKAMELAETTSGPMNAAAKRAREQALLETWARAKDEFIKGAEDRRAASRQFWTLIDLRLDQNLTNARKARGL